MVRPEAFSRNIETAVDNSFQFTPQPSTTSNEIQETALREFDELVKKLRIAGIHVDVAKDTVKMPDAVYPNNWISFHNPTEWDITPTITVYPMKAPSRRKERRKDIIQKYSDMLGAKVKDYSSYEAEELFLEGTGSMILDRINNTVYACISQRTHSDLLLEYCRDTNSSLVSFTANSKLQDGSLSPVYHTNVMMSIGRSFAVVCLESITDKIERNNVLKDIMKSGREILPISLKQMTNFAGNILQLRTSAGEEVVVMSTRAYQSFTKEQLQVFSKHSSSVVHSDLDIIEKYGGGGARCMIAEVFPPLKP